MNLVALTPVTRSGYWRVELKWPNRPPHYYRKFLSRTEAEKWIAQHRWLNIRKRAPGDPEAVNNRSFR
jgi:hypothetical protein